MTCTGNRTARLFRRWIALGILAFSGTLGRAQQLAIISPADAIEVAPGQTLTVEVKVTGAYRAVVIGAADPIGLSAFLSVPPYRFSIPIPPQTRAGEYTLNAYGYKQGGTQDESPSLTIDVERPDVPEALTLAAGRFFRYIGDLTELRVIGTFSGDQRLDLTYSTKTTYSSDTRSVVTVDASGRARAIGPGSANITISHRGKQLTVPVVVPDIRPPARKK